MQAFLTETLAKEAKDKLQKKRNLFGLGLTSLIAACSGDAVKSAAVDDNTGGVVVETPEQRAARLAREAREARAEALPIKAEAFLDNTSGFTANESDGEDSLTVEVEKPGSAGTATLTFADGAATDANANIYRLTPNLDQYDLVISAPNIDKNEKIGETEDANLEYQKGGIFIYWNVAAVADERSTHLEIKGAAAGDKIGTHAPDFYKINNGNVYDMVIRSQYVDGAKGAIYILWDVAGYAATTTSIALNNVDLTSKATAGSLAIYGAAADDKIGIHAPDFYKINDGNVYDMVIRSQYVDGAKGAIYILWDVAGYAATTTSIALNNVDLTSKATAGSLAIYGAAADDKIGIHAPDFLKIGGKDGVDMVIRSDTAKNEGNVTGAIYILWDVVGYAGNKTIDLGQLDDVSLGLGATSGSLVIYSAAADDKIGTHAPDFLKIGGKDGVDMVIRSDTAKNEDNVTGAIYILWDVAEYYKNGTNIAHKKIDLGAAAGAENYASSGLLTIYGAAAGANLGSDDNNVLYGKDANGNKMLTDIDGDQKNDIAFRNGEYTYILFGNRVAAMAGDTVISKIIDLNDIKIVLDENFDNGNFFSYDFDESTPNTVTTRVGYRFKEGDKKADLAAVQTAYNAGVVDAPELEFGKDAPESTAPDKAPALKSTDPATESGFTITTSGDPYRDDPFTVTIGGDNTATLSFSNYTTERGNRTADIYQLSSDENKYNLVVPASAIDGGKGKIFIFSSIAEIQDETIQENPARNRRLDIQGATADDKIGIHPLEFFQLGGIDNNYDMIIRSEYVDKPVVSGNDIENVGAIYILWDVAYYSRSNVHKTVNLGNLTQPAASGSAGEGATLGSLAIYGTAGFERIGINAPEFLQLGGKDGDNDGDNYDMVIRPQFIDGRKGAIYILWDVAEYRSIDRGKKNKTIDLENLDDKDDSNGTLREGATAGSLAIKGATTLDQIGEFVPEFLQIGGKDDNYDIVIRSQSAGKLAGSAHSNEGAIYILWDVADYYGTEASPNNKTIDLADAKLMEKDDDMGGTLREGATAGSLAIYGAKRSSSIGIEGPEFLQIGGEEDDYDMIIRSEFVDKDGLNSYANEGAIYILWDVADYYQDASDTILNKRIDLGAAAGDTDNYASSGLLTIYGAAASATLGRDDTNVLYGYDDDGNKILTDIDGDGTKDIAFRDRYSTYILFGDKVAEVDDGTGKVASKIIDLAKIIIVQDKNFDDGNFFSYDFDEDTPNTVTTRVGYNFALHTGSDSRVGYTTLDAVQSAYNNAVLNEPYQLSDANADLGVWDIV